MKNKKFTYVLVVAVVAIWGIIIYRIITAVGATDQDDTARQHIKADGYNDFAVTIDTVKLLVNYRDPFGLMKQKDTVAADKKFRLRPVVPLAAKPSINWSFIQYDGYMYNPASKKMVTLLTINNKNETLTDGAIRDNVKLLKNMRDSIKISYNGVMKFIPRRSSQ